MSPSFAKPLFFAALTGTSGVGGYYGSKMLTSKPKVKATREKFSIASLIAKDAKKELLSKEGKQGSDSDWKAAWKNYKDQNPSATTANSDPWQIPNWLTAKSSDDAPTDFMNKCDTESKKEVFDTSDSAYTNVYKWCTKDKASSA
ncbi:hypothetical protein HF1_12610 [Mycoplasma haemofelis str. Langford 1]|uniref:Uncharacterized protein n=1 Tax=Mycoplasma haemofelis (strain Langford 1) TaxID=941640 RepID=E8ZJE8_MYCHL|nr:hypothetical protein [Mycoplasma haemofelis]CBY93269.1 hypothetical protein HF1_12610 [Mycoplasma haemofelis str. Langford 1]